MVDCNDIAVVGVGASAGGLEAYQELVSHIAPGQPRAWVLVQHLDPDHDSLLPELLARRTKVPVRIITDGMKVESGALHLIPPAAELKIVDRTLRLTAFNAPRGLRRPIDVFFESLATDLGGHCAAIVLSGTGSDGSEGIRAVKEAGGLVFVQDPKQAKYDGMPKSALATNAVDLVLPVGEMVAVLEEFFGRRAGIEPQIQSDAQFIEGVTKHLRYRTGHDFSHYKRATLLRRLARRMSVLGITNPAAYLQRLITDANEATQLFRDILINVTSFFRDPASFEAMQKIALAGIAGRKRPGEDIRIWVPGCSTGQEAYAIAMLVEEELSRIDARPNVSIFATDIDVDALRVAREGTYPNSIAAEVPPAFLDRHFISTPNGYRISTAMREMVRVSQHNVSRDPPFSRLDLISCRNLLIYFDNTLQSQVMSIFQYALQPGGFLFLGPSENAAAGLDGFTVESPTDRIFRRKPGPAPSLNLPLLQAQDGFEPTPAHAALVEQPNMSADLYERAVLTRHAPPFVVVDSDRRVIYASGRTSRFLELPAGRVNLSVLDMIHSKLKPALRGLITSVGTAHGATRVREIELPIETGDLRMLLTVERLTDENLLIVFQDRFDPRAAGDTGIETVARGDALSDSGAYVHELEQKLDAAYQTIRTTVEELETSNEELKSSNEEMMSMNEELQSANEELSTINEELQIKVAELNSLNDDQRNLIESTKIATIFLGPDLTIRTFTPTATRYFRLLPQDKGRPFEDIVSLLEGGSLLAECRRTLDSGVSVEEHRSTEDGEIDLLVKTQPYVSSSGTGRGVVVTLTEITELTRYARRLEEAQELARTNLVEIEELYRVTPQAKAVLDERLRLRRLNQRFADLFGLPLEQLSGRDPVEVQPVLGKLLVGPALEVLETGRTTTAEEITVMVGPNGEDQRVFEIDWYPIQQNQHIGAVGLNMRDVTKHKLMEAELRRLMRELQHRVKNMLANVTALINRARREQGDPKEIMMALVRRVQALSKTHNLLTSQNWRPASIDEVLRPELSAVYGDSRVVLHGPPYRINARATLAIGMAIHELATNAAKYGALSSAAGQLVVSWSRVEDSDGDRLIIKWEETNGPPIVPPEKLGFGTQLVRTSIEKSLGGEIEMSFEPPGFKAIIQLPFYRATEDDADATDESDELQGTLR